MNTECKVLWEKFGDVPIDENENIEIGWGPFPAGTFREVIWHWFEEQYGISVGELVNGGLEEETMSIDDYNEGDFFEIDHGDMHFAGYFYDYDGQWASVEYSNYFVSLEDFVNKYHNNPSESYEELGTVGTQYLYTPSNEGYDEKDVIEVMEKSLAKSTPIRPEDINENTPDGYYVMEV